MTKETPTWPRTKSKNMCIIYNCLGYFRFFRGGIQTRFSSRCSYCQTKDWVFFGRKVSLYAFLALVACVWLCKSLKTDLNMKKEEDKKKNRRKTLHSLCSVSALLLSVVCCIALIHVELRIQEHHRLISHSVTFCDQMQTQILRKVQQNYERWQFTKADGLKGHLQGTNGEEQFYNSNTQCYYQFVSDSSIMKIILA